MHLCRGGGGGGGFGGITRLVFLLAKRAHLFCRRSQWEAVLLISLGQTLACVKCLQNQHWQEPRALVDICVCSSTSIYTLAQTLLYHFKLCVDGFSGTCSRKMNVLSKEKHIYCAPLLTPRPLKIHLCFFSSWQSGEHRASVHQGETGRRDSIYLADANPDPEKGGH